MLASIFGRAARRSAVDIKYLSVDVAIAGGVTGGVGGRQAHRGARSCRRPSSAAEFLALMVITHSKGFHTRRAS